MPSTLNSTTIARKPGCQTVSKGWLTSTLFSISPEQKEHKRFNTQGGFFFQIISPEEQAK